MTNEDFAEQQYIKIFTIDKMLVMRKIISKYLVNIHLIDFK